MIPLWIVLGAVNVCFVAQVDNPEGKWHAVTVLGEIWVRDGRVENRGEGKA